MKKTIIVIAVILAFAGNAHAASLRSTTLRVGSTGDTVKIVQQKLLDLGYLTSKVDGKYGRKTAEAVAKFQAARSLKADGLVGEKTFALLVGSKISTDLKTVTANSSTTVDSWNKDGTSSKPITGDIVWARTCSDGKPHIQVLSPNGGEVYEAGQQITVKWRSCNLQGNIGEINLIPLDMRYGHGMTYDKQVSNTGSYTLTLPKTVDPYWSFGKNFKIELTAGSDGSISDVSDNLFTINNPTDMCRNISGIQEVVPAGMISADGNCFATTDSWATDCSNGKPRVQVITPNGNEIYTAGQRIDTKWKTCNIPEGMKALVILNDTVHSMGGDLVTDTQNDGYESVVLPTPSTWGNMQFGKFYNVRVSFTPFGNYSGIMLSDASDNIFTINQGGILNPKTNTTVSAD